MGLSLDDLSEISRKLFKEAQETEIKEDYDLALRILDKEIKTTKDLTSRHYNQRGICLCALGEYNNAIENYSNAIDLHKGGLEDSAILYANRGDAQVKRNMLMNALSDYKEAVIRDPKASYYLFKISKINKKLNQKEKMRQNFEEGLRVFCTQIKDKGLNKISEVKNEYPNTLEIIKEISQETTDINVALMGLFE